MKHPNAIDADDWDRHWKCFADAASLNPAQQFRHQIIVQKARETWQGRTLPARFLDLGSGQGDLLAKFHRVFPAWELAGFEMSALGVAVSRAKLSGARFIEADLFHPPADLAEFAGWADLAACSEVLEHVDDPAAFLRAAAVYLRPGARLFITVPGGPMSAFDRHIGHRRHFTAPALAAVISEAGLCAERVWRGGFPFFNVYRLMILLYARRLIARAGGESSKPSSAERAAAGIFRGLFRLCLADAPGGWQIVARARRLE